MTHDNRPASSPVFVQCAQGGCTRGLTVRPEHADNFDARGWRCPEHEAKR